VEPHIELIFFGLLVAVSGLAVVARLVSIPYPILLVLGGLAFGFVPGVPDLQLEPDLVLLLFLPPLLYAAAFFANLRELRANARPIGMLAIGLVIATMLTVAAVAHEVVGLSWPVAFVLGAVVSPTDAVERTRMMFDYRRRRFASRVGNGSPVDEEQDDFDYEGRAETYQRFMHEVIGAQRTALRRLRDEGDVSDDVRRRVEYDLDLEEARLSN